MKHNKYLYVTIILLFIIIPLVIVSINKYNSSNNKDKVYLYSEEGFGGDFTITLRNDGTASFYEGELSSYIGEGKWVINNNVLTLSDSTFTNYFKVYKNKLIFIEENSTNFPYVNVKDGDKFILK